MKRPEEWNYNTLSSFTADMDAYVDHLEAKVLSVTSEVQLIQSDFDKLASVAEILRAKVASLEADPARQIIEQREQITTMKSALSELIEAIDRQPYTLGKNVCYALRSAREALGETE